jgi:hypothetical protein
LSGRIHHLECIPSSGRVISDSEMSEQEGDDDDDDDDLKRDVWRDDLQDPDDEFGKSDAEFDQISFPNQK